MAEHDFKNDIYSIITSPIENFHLHQWEIPFLFVVHLQFYLMFFNINLW